MSVLSYKVSTSTWSTHCTLWIWGSQNMHIYRSLPTSSPLASHLVLNQPIRSCQIPRVASIQSSLDQIPTKSTVMHTKFFSQPLLLTWTALGPFTKPSNMCVTAWGWRDLQMSCTRHIYRPQVRYQPLEKRWKMLRKCYQLLCWENLQTPSMSTSRPKP